MLTKVASSPVTYTSYRPALAIGSNSARTSRSADAVSAAGALPAVVPPTELAASVRYYGRVMPRGAGTLEAMSGGPAAGRHYLYQVTRLPGLGLVTGELTVTDANGEAIGTYTTSTSIARQAAGPVSQAMRSPSGIVVPLRSAGNLSLLDRLALTPVSSGLVVPTAMEQSAVGAQMLQAAMSSNVRLLNTADQPDTTAILQQLHDVLTSSSTAEPEIATRSDSPSADDATSTSEQLTNRWVA